MALSLYTHIEVGGRGGEKPVREWPVGLMTLAAAARAGIWMYRLFCLCVVYASV